MSRAAVVAASPAREVGDVDDAPGIEVVRDRSSHPPDSARAADVPVAPAQDSPSFVAELTAHGAALLHAARVAPAFAGTRADTSSEMNSTLTDELQLVNAAKAAATLDISSDPATGPRLHVIAGGGGYPSRACACAGGDSGVSPARPGPRAGPAHGARRRGRVAPFHVEPILVG